MHRSLYLRVRALAGERAGVSRRDFLATSFAATAGLLSACSLSSGRSRRHGKRVVVVGAGFAGLACAYELQCGGYDVMVVEARSQVGGRVRSSNQFVPGRNVEIGGELIGRNHPTWMRYRADLGLELLELSEDEQLEQPVWLDGRRLGRADASKLHREMDEVFAQIDADASLVVEDEPWRTPTARALDLRTSKQWIDALNASELCRKALAVELSANNGVPIEQQSYLGNLCQVKGGGGAKAYREDSETHRCKGGNQQLAWGLATRIGEARVRLGLPVTAIDYGDDTALVRCMDGSSMQCDDVVLAVPPGIWPKIEFRPALAELLRPQMGKGVKFFVPLQSRFWKANGCEQYVFGDGKVSMTWDSTDGQDGDDKVVMAAFSGAHAAEQCIALPAGERDQAYFAELERFHPGFAEQVAGKTLFMDWTREPWTKACYSFPAPGEVTSIGPMLHEGLGNLHFAGEHTCYKFVGYMEGALHSGAVLARRLAQRDGLIRE